VKRNHRTKEKKLKKNWENRERGMKKTIEEKNARERQRNHRTRRRKGGAEPRGGKTERRTKTQRNWRVKKKKTEGTSKGDTKTVRGIGQLTHERQPRPRVRHPLLPPNRRTRRK
jgi:hypothetical protein